jgi:NAD(P)-dependent dehydrogenase (short-subunit alcohol dehydrogenase family)
MIASFDALLRKSDAGRLLALTSSVGATPRAFWGAYGASKAALENLVECYGDEVKNLSQVRTVIVDPGRTRTAMRAKAYPGEDPSTVKEPLVVADAIVQMLKTEFATGHRLVVEG